ncbi:MAG: TRAP transporter substrate-binding protein [Betaproteobacteria bacterium]|nr:MAG: TRAP transporter substrate-binding protein [Betaproteobacteria bacterium]
MKQSALVGILFAAALGAQSASAQERLKLSIGSTASPAWSLGKDLHNVMKPNLEKYSGGRIELTIHGGGALCNEQGCVEQMKLGQIDMATVSSGNVGTFGTTFDIINLPYLFKDAETANRISNAWLAKELSRRAEKEMKVHVVALVPVGGFRNIVNTQREVRVPGDLKGLKIRVTKSPTEFNLVRAWGAVPVPYDWAQLYEGLQSGVVQGMYLQDAFTSAGKFFEVVKHVTVLNGAYSAHPILMDLGRYNKLPQWAKEALAKVGADLMRESYALDVEWVKSAGQAMQGKVKSYNPRPDEMAQWHKGAKDAWVAVKGTYDPKLALRILEEQGQKALIADLKAAKAL